MTVTEDLVFHLLKKYKPSTHNQEQLEIAYLAFIDYLACLSKGLETTKNQAFIKSFALLGEKKIWFSSYSTTPERLALLQGYLAHYEDLDDVLATYRGHPSAVIFSALLAVSENDVQLKDFLWSYVQGVELAGRLGQQFQPQHVKDGWHATATIGTLAATAAIGNLKQLSNDRFSQLLSLATSQASGFLYQEGTDGKPLNAGFAARNAVVAYQIIRAGLSAYEDPFSSQKGWSQTIIGKALDSKQLLENWLQPSQLEKAGLWFKNYPICSAATAGLEAAHKAYELNLSLSEIESLVIHFTEDGDRALTHRSPQNGIEGKFSIEYITWLGLTKGKVDYSDFSEKTVDQAFHQFRNLIIRKNDLKASAEKRPICLEIITKKDTYSFLVEDPKGSPANPLLEDDIFEKASQLSHGKLDVLFKIKERETLTLGEIKKLHTER